MSHPLKRIRCAVYTRKSSDEGLDQEFNSLNAQREAGEAFVKSQAHEGWDLIDTEYDDGGYSGGNMDRPALRNLLQDITSGMIDVVVVYKIDRLTRSLSDFSRMVEMFDEHEVSFVSVTQAFNTTNSMGRLTLNVLLSFAQFEREVTGERIRDKIAASKAKGMWMGGTLPLGYDLPEKGSRTLRLNVAEAETVRLIFYKYLELGSVHALVKWARSEGLSSKQRTLPSGRNLGGQPFSRGALYYMLRNDTYRGFVRHKGSVHKAQHPPIVSNALFEKVRKKLDANNKRGLTGRSNTRSPLKGRIYDATGEIMSPTHSRGKGGKQYRYYVSSSLQKGGRSRNLSRSSNFPNVSESTIRRISADALEKELTRIIGRLLPSQKDTALAVPRRIEIYQDAVHLVIPANECAGIQARLEKNEKIETEVTDSNFLRLVAPLRIRNRRGRTEIQATSPARRRPDAVLINALRRAHSMVDLDARKLPICRNSPATQYGRRLVQLAFLAPDLQEAILSGTQPADLTLEHLIAQTLPIDWHEQRRLFRKTS
jgi:DNA invertase Pin-like site-specific DNA recombinase